MGQEFRNLTVYHRHYEQRRVIRLVDLRRGVRSDFLVRYHRGTFADRWRPKRTMVASDFLSAASIVVVMLVLAFGSWKALFFATLVSAIMSQFSQPSAMKLFKQHVPQEQLQGVMAMFQSMMAFFMVIGPIIGAFIYAQFGIEVSLGVMGAMFVCSGLVLLSLPKDSEVRRANKGKSFSQDLKDGFRFVFKNRELRTLGVRSSYPVSRSV